MLGPARDPGAGRRGWRVSANRRLGQLTHPERAVAAVLFVVLVATSSRYGWHRDELYFLVAGHHPAWGYPDQPLLTPLLVAGAAAAGHGSLVAVRVVAALESAGTALVVGGLTRDMGGSRRAVLVAAVVWAVGSMSLVTGHYVDTTMLDILATAGCCRCLLRAVRDTDPRWVAAAGVVLGLGFLNKLLIGVMVGCVVLAILVVGPRGALRSRWTLVGAAAAALGAAPFVIWQAVHGWPQITVAHAIAGSGPGAAAGALSFQFLLVSPVLFPVWVAGLVRLARDPAARPYRGFALAYPLALAVVLAGHGKGYYTAGLFPVLVAAGGLAVDGWLSRARSPRGSVGLGRRRRGLLVTGVALSLLVEACIGLAVLPVRALAASGVDSVNPDEGEQVGWPAFTAAVAAAWHEIPPGQRDKTVVFTRNYGEAGAVDHFGPALGLPRAYSGHNGFGLWGPPPDRPGPVVVVGEDPDGVVAASFEGCRVVVRVDNGVGLDDDEQGQPVRLCTGTRRPWSRLWPTLVHDN